MPLAEPAARQAFSERRLQDRKSDCFSKDAIGHPQAAVPNDDHASGTNVPVAELAARLAVTCPLLASMDRNRSLAVTVLFSVSQP